MVTAVTKSYSRLNVKITLMFMIVIIALFLLSSGKQYIEFNNIYRSQIMDDLDQIMSQNKINIDHMVNSIDQATTLLYADPTIIDLLNHPSEDFVQNYQNKEAFTNQLIKYIYVPLSSSLTSYEISFFVSDGMPFSKYLSPTSYFFSGVYNSNNVAGQPWYAETVRKDGLLYWFLDEKNQDRLYVARLIKNPQSAADSGSASARSDMGVVVINFDITQIKKQIESSKLTRSTEVVLLDEKGQILYNHDISLPADILKEIAAKPEDGTGNGIMDMVSQEGKTYIYNLHGTKNGWKLVAFIPVTDMTERLSIVKKIIWTTTGLAILAGLALSIILSFQISRPIRRLALTMSGIQNPQAIQVTVKPQSNDEVGILYASFNKMMKRINELMDDVYRSGVKEKEAELKALQAQINPHFLYNTLDSVNWMALGIGADRIATMISSLASILRYSIKDPSLLVPIREEIEQVKHYIGIQKQCYDHRFDVEFELPPELLDCKTPKLIIQPLVENAIQHGIELQSDRGKIAIKGYFEEETVVLTVDNTGDGTDHAELNAYLAGTVTRQKESGGYGIRNVDQRIKLLFGSGYGLSYEDNRSGGVTAIIKLPRNRKEAHG